MSALGGVALTLLRPPARAAERAAIGVLEAALAAPVTEQAVNLVVDSPLVERALARAVEHLLADGGLERIVVAAMESSGAAELGDRILESPQAERLVARVIESRLLDEAVARLLESKDLWLLVDEVARSPSVTQAISHQSRGFAEEMADVVRDSSHRADARVERAARRLLRRDATGHGHVR